MSYIHNVLNTLALLPLIKKIFRRSLDAAQHVCTVTEGLKQYLVQRYTVPGEKILLVPCGVNTDYFKPRNSATMRIKLGFDPKKPVIGIHGDLKPWHGADFILRAMPHIIAELPDAVCLIVGCGTMLTYLTITAEECGLKNHVICTGPVPFEKIADYVNCFDVGINFFKPIRMDPGSPVKMYEYMACGVPVIASDVPGYGDFIDSAKAGIIVNAENPVQLAKKIVKLLKDRALREKMGKAGRAEVAGNHTWMNRANKIYRRISGYRGIRGPGNQVVRIQVKKPFSS